MASSVSLSYSVVSVGSLLEALGDGLAFLEVVLDPLLGGLVNGELAPLAKVDDARLHGVNADL